MTHCDTLCIDAGVDPLLTELREPVGVFHADNAHPARRELQTFIGAIFRRAHGARVDLFYPGLLGYTAEQGLRAAVGYRAGLNQSLFAEHYLDIPAEHLITARTGRSVVRGDLVEVGNLALSDPGHARWVIAASTAFLAAAGYRWVLFTATRPLANAFRRLGLRPVRLADADPARLPDGGAAWGSYYRQGPAVYAGDILAGAAKLQIAGRVGQPHLHRLLRAARELGAASAFASTGPAARVGLAP
jgi:hypothetical protein